MGRSLHASAQDAFNCGEPLIEAYYHDIGKLRQPQYFVENQKDGHNPHDNLSPSMRLTRVTLKLGRVGEFDQDKCGKKSSGGCEFSPGFLTSQGAAPEPFEQA